ncbi:hypothetical protein GCM10020255_018340 [Rhodococcus baikonurensis]
MVARTLGQQALPTTFGLLASSWFTALDAAAIRLEIVLSTLPVQFGGAAGTLAALYRRRWPTNSAWPGRSLRGTPTA